MAHIDARGSTVNDVKGDQHNQFDIHGEAAYQIFYFHHAHSLKVNLDVIQHCVDSSNPIPRLSPAFSSFRFIWKAIERAKINKSQLYILSECVAQLLKALDIEYRSIRLKEEKSTGQLEDLNM